MHESAQHGDGQMADITMCRGKDCPNRKTCYRYTAPVSEFLQSYFVEPPYDKEKGSCDYYWPTQNAMESNRKRS